jgi:hypothetical protein
MIQDWPLFRFLIPDLKKPFYLLMRQPAKIGQVNAQRLQLVGGGGRAVFCGGRAARAGLRLSIYDEQIGALEMGFLSSSDLPRYILRTLENEHLLAVFLYPLYSVRDEALEADIEYFRFLWVDDV